MTIAPSRSALDRLETLFTLGAVGRLTDAELLARFIRGRGDVSAEAAFAVLVDRHGPMVMGACRRATGDLHLADDAFQATFLVLARKARSIRLGPDDSLGRWLYAVSRRVARRARATARRRAASGLEGVDPADPSPTPDPCERADLRDALDAEIARLPARYRRAVILCHLEGLTTEQAASRLRCPVGTVQSRLHRARERLRSGLLRRGLAPAVGGVAALLDGSARAAVSRALIGATAAAAGRLAAGEVLAKVAPAAVAGLVGSTLRGMMMRGLGMLAGVAVLGASITGGAFGLALAQDEPKVGEKVAKPKMTDTPEAPSLADRLREIQADYDARNQAYWLAIQAAKSEEEARDAARKLSPDLAATVRRITDLGAEDAKDPAVRDAMIWVIRQTLGYSDDGPYAGEFALAASWLLQHHGDDPDAVRIGLRLDNVPGAERDRLLLGFYASARGREAKGLARLALAKYLVTKAMMAEGARKVEGRQKITYIGVRGYDGTTRDVTEEQSDAAYAYLLHLKQCDVDYLRDEAERLFQEVIDEYGDVPFLTLEGKEIRDALAMPEPTLNGKKLTEDEIARLDRFRTNAATLGTVAEAALDDWLKLTVGSPAPEFEGTDLDGQPIKLSDYRGKVVALVFWGSWCGPCMREIPREKALVERMQGRPFAMIGINTDAEPGATRKAIEAEKIAWPNLHDGDPGEGPIVGKYHIRSYPTVFVIDAEGVIRSKKSSGESLERLVEELVAKAEGE